MNLEYILNPTLARAVNVLSHQDKIKTLLVVIVQFFLGILDLLGVISIGLLGALVISDNKSINSNNAIDKLLMLFSSMNLGYSVEIVVLCAASVIFLIGRTLLSIFFTRRILFFLSNRGAKISAELVSRLLSKPLLTVQMKTSQETLFALTTGVVYVTMQVLATSIVMVSDFSILLILGGGLFFVDPVTAIGTAIYFTIIAVVLYQFMHVRAGKLGEQGTKFYLESNEKIVEVLDSYRESVVRNRRDFYAGEIGKLRYQLANASAELSFLPYVSKYVIESAVVLGALIIAVVQFVLQDSLHAVATLSIFLAAGTRIAPAVLRLQQGALQVKGSLGMASPTLDLIEMLGKEKMSKNSNDAFDVTYAGFVPKIDIQNLSLTYPGKINPALDSIQLTIAPGTFVAFVGPSGAGKTTLVDTILGILIPDSGEVLISGVIPVEAIMRWPGAISYVPQDVAIIAGSIRDNISLGYPRDKVSADLIAEAVELANLSELIEKLPNGLDTWVGEKGAQISGGERQRLGVARALYTKPRILVLDEATSALDGETEAKLSDSIEAFKGKTSVLMIAHRLSTIMNADRVVYLDSGRIVAAGSFTEVRKLVPEFDNQARLMGL